MHNRDDSNGSNTASLPPPKGSAVSLLPSDTVLTPWSSSNIPPNIAQTLPSKKRRKDFAVCSSASVDWRVPPDVGLCVAKSLRDRWQSYRKQLRQCQKEFSEGSVHQLRVTTRRLMTQCTLVSCVTSGNKAEKARQKLKRRLKILGELRDTQVQRMFIEEQMVRFPELTSVRGFLQRREHELVRTVSGKVHRFKTRKLGKWTLALCQELATHPEDPCKRDLLATKVFCAMEDAFEEVARRSQTIDSANSQTIHRTRVAFKKFRYMVEALSPAFTGLGKSQLRRFGNYQRRMGNLQDLEIVQMCVARCVGEHSGTETLLQPFSRYLKQRRARLLRLCLRHADDLFQFWHPAWSERHGDSDLRRTAA
jgi:CHAD domain-containing protein